MIEHVVALAFKGTLLLLFAFQTAEVVPNSVDWIDQLNTQGWAWFLSLTLVIGVLNGKLRIVPKDEKNHLEEISEGIEEIRTTIKDLKINQE